MASKQAFLKSRMADGITSFLSTVKFQTVFKMSIQLGNTGVARTVLKCFHKFITLGYMDRNNHVVDEWIDSIAANPTFMDFSQNGQLILNILQSLAISLKGYSLQTFNKLFGICFHIVANGNTLPITYLETILRKASIVVQKKRCLRSPSLRRNDRLSVFGKVSPDCSKTGLEMVVAFLDDNKTSLGRKGRRRDRIVAVSMDDYEMEIEDKKLNFFESFCQLSSGRNGFIHVKGHPPYRNRSKLMFLRLMRVFIVEYPSFLQEFANSRRAFHTAITNCLSPMNLEILERLIAMLKVLLKSSKITHHLSREISVLLEIIFHLNQSSFVQFEAKNMIRQFLLTDLIANPEMLLTIFKTFDLDRRYHCFAENLVENVAKEATFQTPTPSTSLTLTLNREDEAQMTRRKEHLKNLTHLFHHLHQHATDMAFESINQRHWRKCLQQRQLLEEGIELFNENAKTGVKFLQENGILKEMNAQDVAKFLLHDHRLDRMAVGDYLGDSDPFCISVMQYLMSMFDFNGCDFITALRQVFAQGFWLPGEGQKVDRIVEAFSESFWKHKGAIKEPIASSGAAHTLAFSIIMLNTDLHNVNLKQRMTKEAFVKNNRGINDGEDFPRDFLLHIYDDILNQKMIGAATLAEISRQMGTATPQVQRKTAIKLPNVHMFSEIEMERLKQYSENQLKWKRFINNQPKVRANNFFHYESAMFQAIWPLVGPCFQSWLETSPDDETNGICLDALVYSLNMAHDFGLRDIRKQCLEMITNFTQRIASVPVSGAMLNLISAVGGKIFILEYLRTTI